MPSFVMLTAYWAETPVLIPVDDIRLVTTRRRRTPSEIDLDLRTYREALERLTQLDPPTDPLWGDSVPRQQEQIARLLRERDETNPGSLILLDAGEGATREQAVRESVTAIAEAIDTDTDASVMAR